MAERPALRCALASSELHDGDLVTALSSFGPNSYTAPNGIFQQTYNMTCRQLDNFGLPKQSAKSLPTVAPAVATMPAPRARASKARPTLATA